MGLIIDSRLLFALAGVPVRLGQRPGLRSLPRQQSLLRPHQGPPAQRPLLLLPQRQNAGLHKLRQKGQRKEPGGCAALLKSDPRGGNFARAAEGQAV